LPTASSLKGAKTQAKTQKMTALFLNHSNKNTYDWQRKTYNADRSARAAQQ